MGMAPLHVLCSNPYATPDMIKQLVSKNHNTVHVRNVNEMTPLYMYLLTKHVISHVDYQKVSSNDLDGVSEVAIALLDDGAEHDIHEMIGMGLEYEVMEVILALNGRCIGDELSKKNEVTGLYPFMSGAISHQCQLADIYMMRKESVHIIY